jgi:hypothetical protein
MSDDSLLKDEMALRRLAESYARAMDRGEPQVLERIFTEDAAIESIFRAQRGIAEIRTIPDMLKKMFASTLHAVHNQTVTITGDTAEGETYCIAYQLKHPKDGKHMRLDYGIKYQDSFRRVNGAWRFSRRYLQIDWTQLTEVQVPAVKAT